MHIINEKVIEQQLKIVKEDRGEMPKETSFGILFKEAIGILRLIALYLANKKTHLSFLGLVLEARAIQQSVMTIQHDHWDNFGKQQMKCLLNRR